MRQIKLKKMRIENFKGCKDRTIEFGDRTKIFGANTTGKTTIFDAFTWLLFNKDSSGNTKFDIRPLNERGVMIDNVEISVEAVVSVGGEEYSLKKVQKQKWVKKRGTDRTEFQGNINEFEINGYPKAEREFKDFISGIVDENIFNLITSPTAFNSLLWKEQREMLMKFVGESSDVQIAEQYGEKYEKLIPELRIASTDDILKKYNKAKSNLNKDLIEIPARIDEVSKRLVTVDVGALEVERAAKEVAVKKIDDELSGGNGKLGEINQKRKQIMESQLRISELQNDANEELKIKRSDARKVVDDCEQKCRDIQRQISGFEFECDKYIQKKSQMEEMRQNMLAARIEEKAKVFPEYVPLEEYVEPTPLTESDLKCPTCGQNLPEEVRQQKILNYEKQCAKAKADYEARCAVHKSKYEKDKVEFESSRDLRLANIVETGQEAVESIRELQKWIDERQNAISALRKKLDEQNEVLVNAKAVCDNIPTVANLSTDEYVSLKEGITLLEKQIEDLSRDSAGRTELEARRAVIVDEIAEIDRKILAADNTKVQARIDELEAEKKSVGQKVAEQEQMIDLTEDFIRTKMNCISEIVNEKFKVVSFRLFQNQINGGLQETCECTVNGVPFSTLNSGHRIVAGLDIINSLSELYGVTAPIFIDNAESVNEFNLPDMDTQLILLTVTEDKELKVEGV